MTKERAIDLCHAINQYLCAGSPIWDTAEIHDAMSMAIEALKAQSITLDNISNAYENGYQQGKFEAQEWIPVSERLPEEEGVYPVVINGTEPVLSVKYEQGFAMGYFAPVDEAWEIDGHEESIHDLEVLAWMELPPYTEEEQ